MKIHGTTKGGAESKKDFGVAFGGAAADACTYRSGTAFTDWSFTGDYAVSSGELQANVDTGYSNNGSSGFYDIGTADISASAWVLRWKWNLESVTQVGNSPATIGVGLYSASASAGDDSAVGGSWDPTQQLAVIFASAESGQRYFQTCTGKASTNFYGTTTRSNLAQDQSFSASYYMQIKRYDDGGTDTLAYSYTTNSDYTTDAVTVEVTNATYMPSSLRFLKIESWQHGGGSGQSGIDSTVETFTFNNDTDEACAAT